MMTLCPSSEIQSSQAGIHPRLLEQVTRHLQSLWRQSPQIHTLEAFTATEKLLADVARPLILDSGCGTGQSTKLIADHCPDSWVIGIDQSAARLKRASSGLLPQRDGNIIWVRAELSCFWQLALQAGWRLQAHYLLYPNPWPKPGHLQRRWHAHPVFPTLLKLGGRLELRTNWKIYADEFALAVTTASGVEVLPGQVPPDGITTAFEQKYRASGHVLYSVNAPDLSGAMATRWPLPPPG
jgi:tRNA G46 methylase TrmB